MTTLEILLLLLGVVVFVASFIMPETQGEMDAVDKQLTKEQIQEMLKEEMKHVHEQVNDVIDETVSYSVEKSERALERLTNDKIQAISEYSGTVLEDIHKNHEETMFLYDMLNDKHENLKEVAGEVSQALKQANETVRMVQDTRQQAEEVAAEMVAGIAEAAVAKTETNQAFEEVEQAAKTDWEKPMDDMQTPDFEPMPVMQMEHVASEGVKGMSETYVKEPETESIEDLDLLREVLKPAKTGASKKTTAKKTGAKAAPKKNTKKKTITNDIALHFDGVKESDNNNELILQLHNQGKSNMAIAKQLGLGIGEVNLVIALFEENAL